MLSTVILLVLLAFAALVLSLVVVELRKQVAWVPATGIVTHVHRRTHQTEGEVSSHSLVVTYEYRDSLGQVHRGEGPLGDQRIQLDDEAPAIELRVDPKDPSRSVVASSALGAGT